MSRLDYLTQLYGERLVATVLYNSYVPIGVDISDSLSIINYLLQYVDNKKVQWVILRLLDCNIRLEDMQRVQEALQLFDKVKNRLPCKDINSFHSLVDLEQAVEQFTDQTELLSNKQKARLTKLEGAEYVIDSADFKVLLIKTSFAAQLYGCGTKWCTAARNNNIFHHYDNKGPLYIILAGDRKFQFHYMSNQFMNERDEPVTGRDKIFLSGFVQWKQFLDIMIKRHYDGYFDERVSRICCLMKPVVNLFELHTNPEVLQWYDVRYKIPDFLLPMIKKPGFKRNSEIEQYVIRDSECAYTYARKVINGRFIEGEPVIAQSAPHSYAYAHKVIKGRFIEGEPVISKESQFAYSYARNVIKGRFVEGEPAIAKSASSSYLYAREALRSRFQLGEDILASSSEYGYLYAKKVIGGRFMQWEKHHGIFALARHQDKFVQLYNKMFGTEF